MGIKTATTTALATCFIFAFVSLALAAGSPQDPIAGMDGLGEFIKAINSLKTIEPKKPDGDIVTEALRAKHNIPARVPIISPHGGSDFVVMVYDSEGSIPSFSGSAITFGPEQYRHLQSLNNLTAVYALFPEEPLKLDGEALYSFRPNKDKTSFTVFYYDSSGEIKTANLEHGKCIYVPGGKFILKGAF